MSSVQPVSHSHCVRRRLPFNRGAERAFTRESDDRPADADVICGFWPPIDPDPAQNSSYIPPLTCWYGVSSLKIQFSYLSKNKNSILLYISI
jgi:hypothetical protein